MFFLNASCNKNKQENALSCFNSINFERFYNKVNANKDSVIAKNYKFYILSKDEIRVEKNGDLVAKILRGRGVFSLIINKSENKEIVDDVENILCNNIN